jgi:hypothetical protein
MAWGKIIVGGLTVGAVGGGVAMALKAKRERERKRKALMTPPAEPQAEGAFVEWKRRGYVGRITRGASAADWLVELRPDAQGGIVQLGMIEPSYELAAELVRNWTDGVAHRTPKAPESIGDFVTYGRTGGLHTIVVARRPDGGWSWIAALTSDVTANAQLGEGLWSALLEQGKFVAQGDNSTYPEATAAADAAVKTP